MDVGKIITAINKTAQTVVKTTQAVQNITAFRDFLKLDRPSQVRFFEAEIKTMTPASFRSLETEFLRFCGMTVVHPDQKIWVMELYAYMKFLEAVHLNGGSWGGFANVGVS